MVRKILRNFRKKLKNNLAVLPVRLNFDVKTATATDPNRKFGSVDAKNRQKRIIGDEKINIRKNP